MASDGKSGRVNQRADTKTTKTTQKRQSRPAGRRTQIHMDSEQQARLLLIGSVTLVLLVAAGFLLFGYWYSVIQPRNRTVLQVDDVKVSYSAMKRRMGYEFFQNVNYQRNPQILPAGTYQALLNELTQITRAEGALGITIDDTEFDEKLRGEIGVANDADQRTFAEALRRQLDVTGLKESEYRRLVRADLIDQKIRDKFSAELPATMAQAKVEVISAQSADVAQQAITRINAGEDFATVAKELSQETDKDTTGGVKEYGPKGTLNFAYEDYAFSAEIGKLSDPPLEASNGLFYVVRVVDRSDQPVAEKDKPTLASNQFSDWLLNTQQDLTTSGALINKFDDKTQADAYTAVVNDVAPRFAAQELQKTQTALQAEGARQTAIAQLTASPQAAPTSDPNATPAVPTASSQPVVPVP